jgi:uncharacterized membrane protein
VSKVYMSLLLVLGILLGNSVYTPTSLALAEEATVYGVLFYSPTCGHCHKVMDEDLPPLYEKYGSQFILLTVDVSSPDGNALFRQAIDRFQVQPERRGVPMLVVGNTVLVGSFEIPDQLPGIIAAGLQSGGIPWPNLPGLEALIQQEGVIEKGRAGFWETFNQDRTANILAVAVLAGMFLSVIWIGYAYIKSSPSASGSWPAWAIPVLSVVGFAIAAYLSYIEITQTEAICGPVGNCNAVQSSAYARLFGWIPIGILGLLGYLAILVTWLFHSLGPQERRRMTATVIWLLALAGTLFSIYLTFLEPFVIGATCIWCITSAIIMTALMWASTSPAMSYLRVKPGRRKSYKTISRKKV